MAKEKLATDRKSNDIQKQLSSFYKKTNLLENRQRLMNQQIVIEKSNLVEHKNKRDSIVLQAG